MDEFGLIEKFFKPLTGQGAPAFNLESDTAIYSPPAGFDLVLTKDVMIEGTHFLKNTEPDKVARKLLRVNLSDLAASGAKPVGYLLGIMAPAKLGEQWFKDFSRGLKADQKEFEISLFGGDTTSGSDTLCLSLTALGLVKKGTGLTRKGARPGDDIYVSGEIGGAFLGLQGLRGKLPLNEDFVKRHEIPEPRLTLGQNLIGLASAAVDVSDGLLADLAHLARASGVGAEIRAAEIPLAARDANWMQLTGAGDDYEILFIAPPAVSRKISGLSRRLGLPLTKFGRVTQGPGVFVFDENGVKIKVAKTGYRHFDEN